jgi:hypothetical protein
LKANDEGPGLRLQLPNGGPNGPFGHEDWDPKLKSAVHIQKGPDGKPTGYTVEIAIPWAGYTKATKPNAGDVWRINFYAMKNNGGVAWSPILGQGSFHKAPRFGKVTWAAPSTGNEGGGDAGQAPVAALGRRRREAGGSRGARHAHDAQRSCSRSEGIPR